MPFTTTERQIHSHIRQEIERRLTNTGAPHEIRAFLLERWALLLAQIYFDRGDRHPDWDAGWRTLNALLWSLLPKKDRRETELLLRLLPTLLAYLQGGCDAMRVPDAERDQLFARLALLHAAVTRAGLQAAQGESGPITRLGQDADLALDADELAGLDTTAATVAPPPQGSTSTLAADTLRVGDAVRFRLTDGDKRLYLQWISPMGGMFLFADAQGLNTLSLTQSRLNERFARGEAARDEA